MIKPRARFEFGVIDGKLYAAGGSSGQIELRKIEMYDPEKKQWTRMADMPTERPSSGNVFVGFFPYPFFFMKVFKKRLITIGYECCHTK